MSEWEITDLPIQKFRPSNEQIEKIKASLWSVGITDDPFVMHPIRRIAWLSESKGRALSVYAAIAHEFGDVVIQTFSEWSRELGLPW